MTVNGLGAALVQRLVQRVEHAFTVGHRKVAAAQTVYKIDQQGIDLRVVKRARSSAPSGPPWVE